MRLFAAGVAIGVLAGVALAFVLSDDARTLAAVFAVFCAALAVLILLWWNHDEPDN